MKDKLIACLTCGVAGAVLLVSSGVSAQSLADIARKEKERRKSIGTPSKVYTNRDLRGGSPLTTGTSRPTTQADATEATDESTPDGTEAAEQPEAEEQSPRDETYWRDRITAARNQVSRSELMLKSLQNRVDGLWAEFTARDDPAGRAVIERDRLEALAELERVRTEIEEQNKNIAAIEDEARRAGVPPGWLR